MEQNLIELLKNSVREQLDLSRALNDEDIEDIIDNVVLHKSREFFISNTEKVSAAKSIFNAFRRHDVLQPLLEDEDITEIMVNGKDQIYIEQKGQISKVDVTFETQEKLEDVIQNIVSKINRVVNASSPICDARLSDGSRVNIVLPPIALNGPIITIRKFSRKAISMEQLVQWKTINHEAAHFLQKAVDAKYNIFISGGTGSGKTTLLNILTNYIPSDERIITIEDSAELQIKNIKNVVRLETRNENLEGRGAIGIRDLIKTSLRMRPDRIVVGEVRGEEAIDMLQAMNTGHEGSLSTGHANSAKDMLSRLETMILTKENMPIKAIRQQMAAAIDIIVHLSRMRDKSRRVMEIVEIVKVDKDEIILNPIFELDKNKDELVRSQENFVYTDKFIFAGIPDWFDCVKGGSECDL